MTLLYTILLHFLLESLVVEVLIKLDIVRCLIVRCYNCLCSTFSDGVGRTGAFICIYYQLERIKTEATADIFQCVKSSRLQRAGLVRTLVRIFDGYYFACSIKWFFISEIDYHLYTCTKVLETTEAYTESCLHHKSTLFYWFFSRTVCFLLVIVMNILSLKVLLFRTALHHYIIAVP